MAFTEPFLMTFFSSFFFLRDCLLGKWGLDGEDPVFGEGGLDALRVGALGQEELPVVLLVHGLTLALLLVLSVDLKPQQQQKQCKINSINNHIYHTLNKG